jgi:hypothetical protein
LLVFFDGLAHRKDGRAAGASRTKSDASSVFKGACRASISKGRLIVFIRYMVS